MWAQWVKELSGGRCEYCLEEKRKAKGLPGIWLEAAHIIGRTNRSTRWLLDNGVALCSGCHASYDQHLPAEKKIRRIVIGEDRYERLSNIPPVDVKKQNYEDVKKRLEIDYSEAMRRKDNANEKSIRVLRHAHTTSNTTKRSRKLCK
jgi:hypothetical protein